MLCVYACVCTNTACGVHLYYYQGPCLLWRWALPPSAVLHLGVGPCKSSSIHAGMSAGVTIMQVLFSDYIYYCDFMSAAPLSHIENTIWQQASLYCGPSNLSSLSSVMFSEPWVERLCCRRIRWGWASQSPPFFYFEQVWISVIVSVF